MDILEDKLDDWREKIDGSDCEASGELESLRRTYENLVSVTANLLYILCEHEIITVEEVDRIVD